MSSLAFNFNGKNELAQANVDRYTRNYTWNIARDTRQSISAIVEHSIKHGVAPYDAAKMIKRHIGLDSQRTNALLNYRDRLAKTKLKPSRIEALADKYHARLLRSRSQTIARTETMGALNSGMLQSWRDAHREGYLVQPGKEWIATPDDLVCPICEPMHGEIVPLDDSFSGGQDFPPAHPRCRCSMGMAKAEEQRRGLGFRRARADKPLRVVADFERKLDERGLKKMQQFFSDAEIEQFNARRVALLERHNVNVDFAHGDWKDYSAAQVRNIITNTLDEVEQGFAPMVGGPAGPSANKTIYVRFKWKTGAHAWGGANGITIDLACAKWAKSPERWKAYVEGMAKPIFGSPRLPGHKVHGGVGRILVHESGHVYHLRSTVGKSLYGGFKNGPDGFLTWEARGAKRIGRIRRGGPGSPLEEYVQPAYSAFHKRNPTFVDEWDIDRLKRVSRRVSKYASEDPLEFVAETYAGLVNGMKFDDEIMSLYKVLGGKIPKLKAAVKKVAAAPKPAQAGAAVAKKGKSLLPPKHKPVGDPIPAGVEGDKIKRVLELRQQGKGYAYIEKEVGLKAANGNNAFRIVKQYGGGRVIDGAKELGGDLAKVIKPAVPKPAAIPKAKAKPPVHKAPGPGPAKPAKPVRIPEGPKGDVIRKALVMREEGKTYSQIDEILYGKPAGNNGSRSFGVIKKYKNAENFKPAGLPPAPAPAVPAPKVPVVNKWGLDESKVFNNWAEHKGTSGRTIWARKVNGRINVIEGFVDTIDNQFIVSGLEGGGDAKGVVNELRRIAKAKGAKKISLRLPDDRKLDAWFNNLRLHDEGRQDGAWFELYLEKGGNVVAEAGGFKAAMVGEWDPFADLTDHELAKAWKRLQSQDASAYGGGVKGTLSRLYARTFAGGGTISDLGEAYATGGREAMLKLMRTKYRHKSWEHAAAAEWLVENIRVAAEITKPLYRGMHSRTKITALHALKPGDKWKVPRITSFTDRREMASHYAKERGEKYTYEIILEGTKKALPTDRWTGMSHTEHLVNGEYEVVRITKGAVVKPGGGLRSSPRTTPYTITIHVRQIGVY